MGMKLDGREIEKNIWAIYVNAHEKRREKGEKDGIEAKEI